MSLKDSLSIMVVDDMTVSRGLIVQALEEIGIMRATTENNGMAALRKLVANPVHLVLSDLNMPELDGLGLLKGLRENRATSQIGFILITGTPTPELVNSGRALGMNNMIKKPFTTTNLRLCIESVVGRL